MTHQMGRRALVGDGDQTWPRRARQEAATRVREATCSECRGQAAESAIHP